MGGSHEFAHIACCRTLIEREADHTREAGSDGTDACRAVASCSWSWRRHGNCWVEFDERLLTAGAILRVERPVRPVRGTFAAVGYPLAMRVHTAQGLTPAIVCRRSEGGRRLGQTRSAGSAVSIYGVTDVSELQWH